MMQSRAKESNLSITQKILFALFLSLIVIFLLFFRNLFFQPTLILRSLGELSIDPEIAFNNNKPTFLEFYAEWCEVCKEMAPRISSLKDEYDDEINFTFLNVDNPKWEKYIRKYDVNGIPQVNIFDRRGNLKSTFIGKQDESLIKESINDFGNEFKSSELISNSEFSVIKKNKNSKSDPRSHG